MASPPTRRHGGLGAHGSVILSSGIRAAARELADQDFQECQRQGFCGDAVRDHLLPHWLGPLDQVLPVGALHRLRLKVREEHGARLYATCGVDEHVDDMDGLAVAVVLYSDGFTFSQGDLSLKLSAGDWFVFDDGLEHAVAESREATSLLVLTAPLRLR